MVKQTRKRNAAVFTKTVKDAVKTFAKATKGGSKITITPTANAHVDAILRYVTTGVDAAISDVIGAKKTVNRSILKIAIIQFFIDHNVTLQELIDSSFLGMMDHHLDTHWDEYKKSYEEEEEEEEEESEGEESEEEEEEKNSSGGAVGC